MMPAKMRCKSNRVSYRNSANFKAPDSFHAGVKNHIEQHVGDQPSTRRIERSKFSVIVIVTEFSGRKRIWTVVLKAHLHFGVQPLDVLTDHV